MRIFRTRSAALSPPASIGFKSELKDKYDQDENILHQHDTPTDAAGHVKSTLIGVDLPLIIHDGKLLLGSSQGIYFLEFDGPRKRSFYVQVMGE